MKRIWLMGGFGNVLFQILAFRVIEKKNKDSITFITYLTEKNFITKAIKWSIHDQLYKHLIPETKITKISSLEAIAAVSIGMLSKTIGKYFNYSTFYIKKVSLDDYPLSKNIFGYFQDKNFLKTHDSELLDLGESIREKLGTSENKLTVIHYRKGDSGWAVTNGNYYSDIKGVLLKSGENAIVVTDSHKDAVEFFKDVPNIEVAKSNSAMDDFKMMLSARKLFCAPSTFSWWAAHTLPSDCEVIAPKFLDDLLGFYSKCPVKLI